MEYGFDIGIAEKHGVNEAIMLKNMAFWIRKNEANNNNFHDGYYWTYNSILAYNKLFPFWSISQINRILKSLEDKGIIKSGVYNKMKYDRTKWYTIIDKCIYRNNEMEVTKKGNGVDENNEPIPYINTDKITNKNTDKNRIDKNRTDTLTNTEVNEMIDSVNKDLQVDKGDPKFVFFWDNYNKKVGRPLCEKKWGKLKTTDIDAIFDTLDAYIKSTPDKQYRKDPATYLNQRAWENEIIVKGSVEVESNEFRDSILARENEPVPEHTDKPWEDE